MNPAKKSLGQNFLKSGKALADIVSASNLKKTDTVLEAGPGRGALTELLLQSGAKVIAVEKDHELIAFLRTKFNKEIANGQFILIEDDILEFKPENFNLAENSYKIVANIPYYITGQFFRKFLEESLQPSLMTVLVQKEVADRIVANDKKESVLSISVKAFGLPRRVSIVKAGSFTPAPNVDSAIITIENISRKNFSDVDEKRFFEIVKTGFSHKRKLVAGNLKSLFGKQTEKKITDCGILAKSRAEDLTLENWLCLAKL